MTKRNSSTLGAAVALTLLVSTAVSAQTVRFYKAAISPQSVAAGSTATLYQITITNCDAATCDASHATSHNQDIRSAGVTVPAGFIVDSGSFSVSASGAKTWAASLSGSTIILGATKGNQGLEPAGESVTVSFNATAPCLAGGYEWTTAAYQDSLNNGALVTSTPYTLFGSQPSVTVNGTCSVSPGFRTGDYCSYSQGGWGAPPHGGNPGQILSTHFLSVYGLPGVTVGTPLSMNFTSAPAVEAYLPAGGPPHALGSSVVNPTSTGAGVFGGQVLSLRLNVNLNDAHIISGSQGPISSLKLAGTGTSLDGKTVAQILAAAEAALGGGALPPGYSISNLNSLIDLLNNAFDSCAPSPWAQTHLIK